MKSKVLTCLCLVSSIMVNAQMAQEEHTKKQKAIIAKAKLGISQIELGNEKLINGSITQLEVLYSWQASSRCIIEYGIGFSQFNGNDIALGEYVYFKNNNLRLPINVLYSHDFNRDVALVFGLGTYGIYYANTKMTGYYEGKGAGVNVGASSLMGANFNISEKLGFRLMAEVQRDLTKIEKANEVNFRERMNALLSLSFVFKL